MEITPQKVMLRLEARHKLHLIDVRKPHEFALARKRRTIPAALQQLEALADNAPLVVYCHHGLRSCGQVLTSLEA
jgi:rhodanese-related sulfurtransferase